MKLWVTAVVSFALATIPVAAGAASPTRSGTASCPVKPGQHTVARSAASVIVASASGWFGCLSSVGAQRVLVKLTGKNSKGTTTLKQTALAGNYAAMAFQYSDSYAQCLSYLDVFDLRTGKPSYTYQAGCAAPDTPQQAFNAIDSVSVTAAGYAAWRVISPAVGGEPLDAVACPSTTGCAVLDGAGNVLTTAAPGGPASGWTSTPLHASAPLDGLACATPTLCLAFDNAGQVLSSTNPGGGGPWQASAADQVAIPSGALTFHTALMGLGCPSSGLCVAVDTVGDILTTTDPTGPGPWAAAAVDPEETAAGAIDPAAASDVSCPSETFCAVVDPEGNLLTSTDPTQGRAAWTVTSFSDPLTAVSCPSAALCVAVGGQRAYVSSDPADLTATWASAVIDTHPLSAISCPTSALCVATDETGQAIAAANPAVPGASWHAAAADPGATGPRPITCPSETLCVGTDGAGNVFTATAPTGPASAWTRTLINGPPCAQAPTCAAAADYAYDSAGTLTLDQSPPAASSALSGPRISGNRITWTDGGTTRHATLH